MFSDKLPDNHMEEDFLAINRVSLIFLYVCSQNNFMETHPSEEKA